MEKVLSYSEWLDLNYDELQIQFAESGADRELDFNPEKEDLRRYNKYLQEEYQVEKREKD
jgi:hypothetical protein